LSNPVFSASEIFDRIQQSVDGARSRPAAICFDFFDTLVHRSILPEETKKIAASQLAEQMGDGLGGEALYQVRHILEKRLCNSNQVNGYDAEFNLTELAVEMHARLQRLRVDNDFKDEQDFIKRFIEIELGVERSVQQVDDQIVEILKYSHAQGVTTAIISDFYLPGEAFSQLLDHHGLSEHVDHLFVSADYLRTKGHNGRLYKISADKIGCEPAQMIMIGDTPHADGTQARAQGLTAYCLKASSAPFVAKPAENEVFEKALLRNRAPFYAEMGLSLHWFIQRLFITVLADGRDNLFCCSKEGEFLQKLFIRYQDLKFGRQVIRSHYLYVSRKATFIGSLEALEQESFTRLFSHYRDQSLTEFLQSLNFSEELTADICKQLQLDSLTRHYDLKNHPDFKILLQASVFKNWYEKIRNEQRENLLAYLSHFKVDFAEAGLTLVDVGWKGSIQNNIFYALGENIEVHGYYLGLLSPTEIKRKNRKTGILFHDVPTHSDYIHVFNNNRSLYEMLLGASHGSADGYYFKEQFRQAKSDHHSYLVEVGDKPYIPKVALLDLPEERALYSKTIQPLQEVFFKLHEDLTKHSGSGTAESPSLDWLARKHARMVFKPRKAEVELFAKLYHLENFGLFEFTEFDDSRPVSTVQKLKNLWPLKKNPEAFLETGIWPPIILRRLGLGFLTAIDGKKRFNRFFGPD